MSSWPVRRGSAPHAHAASGGSPHGRLGMRTKRGERHARRSRSSRHVMSAVRWELHVRDPWNRARERSPTERAPRTGGSCRCRRPSPARQSAGCDRGPGRRWWIVGAGFVAVVVGGGAPVTQPQPPSNTAPASKKASRLGHSLRLRGRSSVPSRSSRSAPRRTGSITPSRKSPSLVGVLAIASASASSGSRARRRREAAAGRGLTSVTCSSPPGSRNTDVRRADRERLATRAEVHGRRPDRHALIDSPPFDSIIVRIAARARVGSQKT
jgi:hypothetical protein